MSKSSRWHVASEFEQLDPQVREVCTLIRTLYLSARHEYNQRAGRSRPGARLDLCQRVPAWDGGDSANGRTYTSVWPKVAKKAIAQGVIPRLLINSVFNLEQVSGRCPTPLEVFSDENIARHKDRIKYRPGEIAALWQSQCTRLRNQGVLQRLYDPSLDEAAALRRAIGMPGLDFKPLFRYVLAQQLGAHEVAREVFSAAVQEYASAAELYDQYCDPPVPVRLKRAAEPYLQFARSVHDQWT